MLKSFLVKIIIRKVKIIWFKYIVFGYLDLSEGCNFKYVGFWGVYNYIVYFLVINIVFYD